MELRQLGLIIALVVTGKCAAGYEVGDTLTSDQVCFSASPKTPFKRSDYVGVPRSDNSTTLGWIVNVRFVRADANPQEKTWKNAYPSAYLLKLAEGSTRADGEKISPRTVSTTSKVHRAESGLYNNKKAGFPDNEEEGAYRVYTCEPIYEVHTRSGDKTVRKALTSDRIGRLNQDIIDGLLHSDSETE